MSEYAVQKLEAEVSVEEYLQACVDVEKFLDCCRVCPNFGRRWSCPPFDFAPMELWKRFHTLRLYARILTPEPEEDMAALLRRMKVEKEKLMAELLQLERENPASMALSAGSCSLCGEDCTRTKGESCRKPREMRYSIEALGGDVSKTAERYLGRPLKWAKDGAAPEYMTLVGGLLLKGEEKNKKRY